MNIISNGEQNKTDMERIEELFPRFDAKGLELVRAAYDIAAEALKVNNENNYTEAIVKEANSDKGTA